MLMKKIAALLLSALLLTSVTACGGATGKLKSVQSSGKIVVYTDPNFPPFEYIGADQAPVGVDMEIARAIADELGVSLEIQEADFDSIITAIKGGRGDIAVSGFTITEERQKSVDFSRPYINSIQYLILMEDDGSITTMESLAGLTVGVAKGYSGQFWIEDEMEEGGVLYDTGVNVMEFNNAMDATLDLRAGRISAVVMDEYVAKSIVSASVGLKTIALQYEDGELAAEEYGVLVAKGNDDLLKIINAVLDKLIGEGKIAEWVVAYSN